MRRALAQWLALTCALMILAAASSASAQKDADGTERIAAAIVLFDAGDFASAAIIFESVYKDTRRSDALFGWAQALRLSGDCAAALPLYEQYLADASPEPHQVDATREAIALCPAAIITEPAGGETGPVSGPEPIDETPDPQPEPRAVGDTGSQGPPIDVGRSRGTDWISIGLGGVAVVSIATSGAFYALARRSSSDADDADGYDDYERLANEADSRQRVALIVGGVGVGAALGLVAWRLWGRGGEEAVPTVTIAPTLRRPGAVVRLRF